MTITHRLFRVLVVAVLASVTACSTGSDNAGPTPPASASSTATPSATATSTPAPVVTSVSAYFVRGEKVAAAHRTSTGVAVSRAAVLALLQGPSAAERASGLTTAVPSGTTLRSVSVSGGVAVVDLSGTFASGGGSLSMRLRLGQLVTTLTQFPTISSVRLWLDGKAATTLGGEGLIVNHPISRVDVEDSLPSILVDVPGAGARISSPVKVRGSSNVFEAVSFIQITDWDGRIVATKRVMASSGTGTRGTFDVTVSYQTTRPGQGELIVYSLSPKDGKRINLIETPLVVAP
jgi:germination protein M